MVTAIITNHATGDDWQGEISHVPRVGETLSLRDGDMVLGGETSPWILPKGEVKSVHHQVVLYGGRPTQIVEILII